MASSNGPRQAAMAVIGGGGVRRGLGQLHNGGGEIPQNFVTSYLLFNELGVMLTNPQY